jgi:hypothetical protein
MMGSWMLVTGLASLFAGDFSGITPTSERQQRLIFFVTKSAGIRI